MSDKRLNSRINRASTENTALWSLAGVFLASCGGGGGGGSAPLSPIPALATNTGLTINSGHAVTITRSHLWTADGDTPAEQVVYTMSTNPGNGVSVIKLVEPDNIAVNTTLLAGATFTQQEINDGLIAVSHDGNLRGNPQVRFRFSVTDGETTIRTIPNPNNPEEMVELSFQILAVAGTNALPVAEWNFNNVNVLQGERVAITYGSLRFTDADHLPSDLTYMIAMPLNGMVVYDATPADDTGQVTRTTFTQAEINAGQIFFVHDNAPSTTEGGFNFLVRDAEGGLAGGEYRLNLYTNEFPIFRPQTIDERVTVTIPTPASRTTQYNLTVSVTESNDPTATSETGNQVFLFSDSITANADFNIQGPNNFAINEDNMDGDLDSTDGIIRKTATGSGDYGTFTIERNNDEGMITVSYALNNMHTRLDTHNAGDTPLEDAFSLAAADDGNPAGTSGNALRASARIVVQIHGVGESPTEAANLGVTIPDATISPTSVYLATSILQYTSHRGAGDITYTLGNNLGDLTANGLEVVWANTRTLRAGETFTQAQIDNSPQSVIFIRQRIDVEPIADSVVLHFTVSDGDPLTADTPGTLNIAITRLPDPADIGIPTGSSVQRMTTVDPVENDDTARGGFDDEVNEVFYFGDFDTDRANIDLQVLVGPQGNLSSAKELNLDNDPDPLNPDANPTTPLVMVSEYGTFTISRDDVNGVTDPLTGLERGTISFSYELDTTDTEVMNLGSGEELFDGIVVEVRDVAGESPRDSVERMNIQIFGVTEVEFQERTNSGSTPIDITDLVFRGQAQNRPGAFTVTTDGTNADNRFVVAQGDSAREYQVQLAAGATLDFDASPRIPLIIKEVNLNDAHIYAILTLTEDDGSLVSGQAGSDVSDGFA